MHCPIVYFVEQAFTFTTMETTRLANKLTCTLAPALPYLVSATGEPMEHEQIPASALAADTQIWQKIAPRAREHPELLEAAINLAKHSRDWDAQEVFQQQVQQLLDEDAALFEDLKKEVIHHCVHHDFDGLPAIAHATQ